MNGMKADNQADVECLLGVERSLKGKRWVLAPCDGRAALAMAQRLEAPEIVGRVLASRQVSLEDAEDFLNPTLKKMLPDPSSFKDMDKASERLALALMQGERIAIYGDYDVDGAASAALLSRFLKALGAPSRIYIPDRLREGYGPNAPSLLALAKEKISLVLMVDCGTTAHDPLQAAASAGLDVIIVDHHKAEAKLPPAVALVNPNRLDETSPHGHMAAVGLCFLLVVGVNRALDLSGWFAKNARPKPNPMDWLDLAAMGAICDVVPLTGVNRALTAQGLKVLRRRANKGLKALADVCKINEPPDAYHVGFVLGPRINAAGRIGDSSLGARLLACDDDQEAMKLALVLDELNQQRRDMETAMINQAMDQANEQMKPDRRLIIAAGLGWHPGVIGIIAGRLVERFNRPALALSINGGVMRGSGRSVAGVDLGAAIISARQAGLLINGGGHAMAAGFSIQASRLDEFSAFMNDRLAKASPQAGGNVQNLELDGSLSVKGATLELASILAQMGPFGAGNKEPLFAIARARLTYVSQVKQEHLRCVLTGEDGGRLDAIAFRCNDTGLGRALTGHDGVPFHVAGRLRVNQWQGAAKAQLYIEDAAPAF